MSERQIAYYWSTDDGKTLHLIGRFDYHDQWSPPDEVTDVLDSQRRFMPGQFVTVHRGDDLQNSVAWGEWNVPLQMVDWEYSSDYHYEALSWS